MRTRRLPMELETDGEHPDCLFVAFLRDFTMQFISITRNAINVGLAGALLAGCSGAQVPLAPERATSQSRAAAAHAHPGISWMLPEAKKQNLLYIANDTSEVLIYKYEHGFRQVGTIYPPAYPLNGICADNQGDVWVPAGDSGSGYVLEYPHGGTTPIATLYTAGYYPSACAVDNTTGNLAVTSVCSGSGCDVHGGSVAIYHRAKGNPKVFKDLQMPLFYFCTYDDTGNLFVDGSGQYSQSFNVAELPKGKKKFINLTVDQYIDYPGGIQWDGTYLAIGDRYDNLIREYEVNGRNATEFSQTLLNGTTGALGFLVQKRQVIVPGSTSASVDFYKYPAGGAPTKSLDLNYGLPTSVAVSVAPTR